MIVVEGIITTLDSSDRLHVAAMGALVTPEPSPPRLTLRPFETSTSLRHLRERGEAVFHLVDDPILLARTVVKRLDVATIPTRAAQRVAGRILTDCCGYRELRVLTIQETRPRVAVELRVEAAGQVREWAGWNRARFAVVEAAILATRVGILPQVDIERQLVGLRPLVEKTGGEHEHQAFEWLVEHIREQHEGAFRP